MTDPQQHVRPIAPIVHLSLPSGGFCNQVDDCQAVKIARISNTFFFIKFVDCLLSFFLLVVSTCALICLVLLTDGFTFLIFIYRFFFKDRKRRRRRRETQKIQSVLRMFIQMKVDGNEPLQNICWLFAFVFFFGLCIFTRVLISLYF